MGVGRREALGVRQLAAALFLSANNVSVPISASEGFFHRLRKPPIGTRGNLRATPQSGTKPKQRACHSICVLFGQAWGGRRHILNPCICRRIRLPREEVGAGRPL
ncbi:MAG: hypothetical protein GX456_08520 [Verrucomicrobia bacterium]|nr:hypothetical protein [Verrucomicrobiota bacterium]